MTGTMHFGLRNPRNFEIDRIGEPEEPEVFKYLNEPRQEILPLGDRKGNPLLRTKGKWPGNESFEELLNDI